ncbi:MAG TPA: Hpt domain-containing protein, partial [Anaerolineae bacterium]
MAKKKRSAEMDEIWSLFAQEGKENLALAEDALLKLERAPDNLEQIKALFRAIHSFKGGARMMGLSVVESLAHHAEDLMALVRDHGVTLQSDMIELLLSVTDRLRGMLDYVLANGKDVEPGEAASLIEMLQQTISSHAPTIESQPTVQVQPNETPAVAPSANSAPSAEPAGTFTDLSSETPTPSDAANVAVDLTAPDDPHELAEFLKKTESDLALLHAALDALALQAPDALEQIQSVTTNLKDAAHRMGYERLVAILDGLIRQARPEAWADATPNAIAEQLLQLKKVELAVFEELTNIQDHATPEAAEDSSWTDIAWLFRHWNAERVYADLARLTEIADALDQLTGQFTVETMILRQNEKAAEEAMVLLKATYHSCIFYHLDQAAHLSLALADIFGRIAQGELMVNDALTRLTRSYVANLGTAIDAIREGAEPPLEEFAKLIEQAQNFLYLHTDGPVFQVTRSVLDVLNLPVDFKEVMTPETMTKFSRALQRGEHFFTVLADLERDEALGAAFLTWSESEGVHLITNITVYRYNRTLFNFLLATPQTEDEVLVSLKKMDPEWQFLTLEACILREQVDRATQREDKPAQEIEAEAGAAVRSGAGISSELIENISETISTMVADHATLRRVLNRLADKDLLEMVLRITRDTQGNEARLRSELEDGLKEWTDGIHTSSQAESQASVALVQ